MNANTKPVDVEEIGRQAGGNMCRIMELAVIGRAATDGWEEADIGAFASLFDAIHRVADDTHDILNPLWGIRS